MAKCKDTVHKGHVYVLKLEDDCWYVGHTSELHKRMRSHFEPQRSKTMWVKAHPAIGIQWFMPAPEAMESVVTEDMGILYGMDKVRGAAPLCAFVTKEGTVLSEDPVVITEKFSHAPIYDHTTIPDSSWWLSYPPKHLGQRPWSHAEQIEMGFFNFLFSLLR